LSSSIDEASVGDEVDVADDDDDEAEDGAVACSAKADEDAREDRASCRENL
jgi:hypothetical protein